MYKWTSESENNGRNIDGRVLERILCAVVRNWKKTVKKGGMKHKICLRSLKI